MIKLYDVSALLYIGNSMERPGDDYLSENLSGLPVKGLRYALEKMITELVTYDCEVIAVMDSHTNKGELYDGYKGNRIFNRDVFIQRELLRFLLPNLGITMLSQNQFEADDLFYCFILDRLTNNTIPSSGIYLYCDDLDLTGCLVDKHIIRMGLNSKTPALTVENYESIMHRKGFNVRYNSILPYILFHGKSSNNLKSIKSAKSNDCMADFFSFVDSRFKGKNNLYSLQIVIESWLNDCKANHKYDDSFYEEIESRIHVVYPRLNWDKDKAIFKSKVDKKIATEFLTLLQESRLLKIMKLQTVPVESINRSILDKWISMYRSGTVNVDNYVTADSTFFFNNDSSGNVGGF